MGYRVMPGSRGSIVLAAPARVDDLQLDRRRRDLGVLVLFATAVGAVAALWLSGVAARQLARPIGALRTAARAVARGERELPLEGEATSEFLPVFRAFRAMAEDLGASRAALEEAQRRTDAVLRTVASGVVAVDEQGRVILANPRAETLLGDVPRAGEPVSRMSSPAVAARVARLSSQRRATRRRSTWSATAGRCADSSRGSSRGGAVLTLDDVTELARAQRVLAWGEMARQVAHEIKNPLTPIRLGVQHLRRARGRPRLRRGARPERDAHPRRDRPARRDRARVQPLRRRAGGARAGRADRRRRDRARRRGARDARREAACAWRVRGERRRPCSALARGDELREVLLNLFENARLARRER